MHIRVITVQYKCTYAYSHAYGSHTYIKSYIYVHKYTYTHHYTANENSQTVSETSINEKDEEKCKIFIGITVVFLATSVVAMAIIVILAWKLCSEKRKSGKP